MTKTVEKVDPAQQAIIRILDESRDPVPYRDLEERLADAGFPLKRSALGQRLAGLRQAREVEQVGGGRSASYRRNSEAAWFSVPPEQRPTISYLPERIRNYIPNQTAWLSAEQKERMGKGQPTRTDASTYARDVAEKLAVDISYASSRLEGNTYTYLDTEVLVRYGQAAAGKGDDETRMILNHKQAVSYLIEACKNERLDGRTIREFHALLAQDLIDPREVGTFRRRSVAISGSSYIPLSIPSRIHEEFDVLVEKGNAISNPFEQSIFWMVGIAYLQPFLDLNKRTGRIACNVPLLRNGLAPLSFMDMDKAIYIKGLLAFYELGLPGTIAGAFTEAYTASAKRYDSHMSRDPQTIHLDRYYKREIGQIVREWVQAVSSNAPDHWEDVVQSTLGPLSLAQSERQEIEGRAKCMLDALNGANRIVYGVSVAQYDAYKKQTEGGSGGAAKRKLSP